MIVVAIIAIMAAVVLPSYTGYIKRGRLTEATSKLADLRTRMEQFYQDNRNYGTLGAACGVSPTSNNSSYFTYTCYLTSDPNATTQTDDQSFVLHAVGTGSMAGYEYTIDQQSAKRTRAFVEASGLPVACWITRPGGTC